MPVDRGNTFGSKKSLSTATQKATGHFRAESTSSGSNISPSVFCRLDPSDVAKPPGIDVGHLLGEKIPEERSHIKKNHQIPFDV